MKFKSTTTLLTCNLLFMNEFKCRLPERLGRFVKATCNVIAGSAIALGLFAADTGLSAAAPALDRGGVSVDFQKFKRIDTDKSGGTDTTNLLSNGGLEQLDAKTSLPVGWANDFWYYSDEPDRHEQAKKLRPLGTRRVSPATPAEGKYCFELGMADAEAGKNTGGKSFSNNLTVTIPALHLEADEKYVLSFRYKAEYSKRGGKLSVYIPFAGADGKETRPHVFQDVPGASTSWQRDWVEFVAPKATAKMSIQFRFTDYGRAFIDDVRLVADKTPGSVTLAVLPFSFIDDTFVLPSGQVGILQLAGRNAARRSFSVPSIVLTLPEAIRIRALRNGPAALLAERPLERDGKKYVEYRIAYSMPGLMGQDKYSMAHGEFILLQTVLPAGETLYPAECYFADKEYKGDVRRFNIRVSAPVHGRQPKLFETGGHIWNEFTYADPGALKELAEFYTGTGFNVIQQMGASSTPQMSAAFKTAGVRRYVQQLMVNGYMVFTKLPEEVRYRRADGSQAENEICPVAVYGKGRYFTGSIVPELRKIIVDNDLADSLMCNWEPYMYVFNGCFCDNCRTEFIKYAKLPAEEVAAVWPKEVTRKYADVWPAFRSWQHAQLLITMEETVAELGRSAGKKSHFIPEIDNHFTLTNAWPRSQYDPRDYMEKLPVIEAWGPYLYHQFTRPYAYTLGNHLSLYERAVDPIEYLQHAIPDPSRRPALIAFPAGFVGGDWILEPEAIAFETLCYFTGGWQGSIAYFFPMGFDGRYFQAMAEANTLIADHEEMVFKGRRIDKKERFAMKVLSPLPPVSVPDKSGLEPSLLQAQEFAYGDRRLFAVGNFWQRGDAWVTITPANLPDNGNFVLRELSRNRTFANRGGKTVWTAGELRKGVTVHVGALRWAFFTLAPWQTGVDYGEVMTPARLEAGLKRHRKELQKNLEAEQALTASP